MATAVKQEMVRVCQILMTNLIVISQIYSMAKLNSLMPIIIT